MKKLHQSLSKASFLTVYLSDKILALKGERLGSTISLNKLRICASQADCHEDNKSTADVA